MSDCYLLSLISQACTLYQKYILNRWSTKNLCTLQHKGGEWLFPVR